MRSVRKPEEQFAVDRILEFLSGQHDTVAEDESVTDAPDLVVEIPGRRVACEMTSLGQQAVFKFYRASPKVKDRPSVMSLPFEPHMWLAIALAKKALKVQGYRSGADECWLVVHTDAPTVPPFFPFTPWVHNALAFTAQDFEHEFDAVLLVHGDRVHPIWKKGDPLRLRPDYDLTKAFPTREIIVVPTEQTPDGPKFGTAPMPSSERILLPILDPRYRRVDS